MSAILDQAIRGVLARIEEDAFCILNESEFQGRLYLELCALAQEEMRISVPRHVLFPQRLRESTMKRRVFREMVLDPRLGRASPRPDLKLYAPGNLVAVPKGNNAISSWKGQYEAIIETKFNARPRACRIDREKYPADLVPSLFCINYKTSVGGVTAADQVIEVGGQGAQRNEYTPQSATVDAALEAIRRVHERYVAAPGSMIREKDFESWISYELEEILGRDGCALTQEGRIVGSTSSVRNQISTQEMTERRHDVLIVENLELPYRAGKTQKVHAASVEIEIKGSHSDQHNWFDGRLDAELNKMVAFKKKFGVTPIFVLFRLRAPSFVDDYRRVVARFPDVKFLYLCTTGQSVETS